MYKLGQSWITLDEDEDKANVTCKKQMYSLRPLSMVDRKACMWGESIGKRVCEVNYCSLTDQQKETEGVVC
jgi:hypothetical protein